MLLLSFDHRINQRRNEAIARRDQVKAKAQERLRLLEGSKDFQDFQRDADELSDWIKEKYITATDNSWQDLTNLLPKLQKHQAFEAELKTNKDRLDKINKVFLVLVYYLPCNKIIK